MIIYNNTINFLFLNFVEMLTLLRTTPSHTQNEKFMQI